jgi:prepilin-type N-terminal cleavage/methylation domain-containing protein
MKQKGFTLIELLVVIAIIGILSSVVLASLNTARGKGADAAIKEDLNNGRASAELFYDNQSPNTYAGVCAASGSTGGLATMVAGATSAGGTNVKCGDASGGWAAEAQLKGDSTHWYCVDSSGVLNTATKITSGTGSADVSCL